MRKRGNLILFLEASLVIHLLFLVTLPPPDKDSTSTVRPTINVVLRNAPLANGAEQEKKGEELDPLPPTPVGAGRAKGDKTQKKPPKKKVRLPTPRPSSTVRELPPSIADPDDEVPPPDPIPAENALSVQMTSRSEHQRPKETSKDRRLEATGRCQGRCRIFKRF